jgi:adenylate cyclase
VTTSGNRLARVAELSARVGGCDDLDAVITVCLAGLRDLFGYEHSMLLALDEPAGQLFTIASHGYAEAGIGSEVAVGLGQGFLGLAAAQKHTVRIGALARMVSYGRAAHREQAATTGATVPEVRLPGLPRVQSQVAAPVMSTGRLLGVLAVESARATAFDSEDEAVLSVAAQLVAGAIEREHLTSAASGAEGDAPSAGAVTNATDDVAGRDANAPAGTVAVVRYYQRDASTFVDGDYLVKGVPGRILWKLLNEWRSDGRVDFTNREVRLDPALELPAFKDNFETRLILLKRRLDERGAPIRIETTGRGRFRLHVSAALDLDARAPNDEPS